MHQHRDVLEQINRRQKELAAHVSRPLWKKLRDQQQCDVQSIIIKERPQLTLLEKARRRASESLYNHNYLGRSAVDIALLRQLRSDRNFLDPLRLATTPPMRKLTRRQFTIVRRLMVSPIQGKTPLGNCTFSGKTISDSRTKFKEGIF